MNALRVIVVKLDGDGLRIEPRNIPEWIKTALLCDRAALLAWLCQPCPGFEGVPPDTMPLRDDEPTPDAEAVERVARFAGTWLKGTPGVETWLAHQAQRYFDAGRGWSRHQCAYAAACDCLSFQTGLDELGMLAAIGGAFG